MPDRKQDSTTHSPTQPTDLPEKRPQKMPTDLPLPRHRPGEPIMYDPPVQGVEIFPIFDPNEKERY